MENTVVVTGEGEEEIDEDGGLRDAKIRPDRIDDLPEEQFKVPTVELPQEMVAEKRTFKKMEKLITDVRELRIPCQVSSSADATQVWVLLVLFLLLNLVILGFTNISLFLRNDQKIAWHW